MKNKRLVAMAIIFFSVIRITSAIASSISFFESEASFLYHANAKGYSGVNSKIDIRYRSGDIAYFPDFEIHDHLTPPIPPTVLTNSFVINIDFHSKVYGTGIEMLDPRSFDGVVYIDREFAGRTIGDFAGVLAEDGFDTLTLVIREWPHMITRMKSITWFTEPPPPDPKNIPEPATILLFSAGLVGLAGTRLCLKKKTREGGI